MRSLALIVPAVDAEKARRSIRESKLLRPELPVLHERDHVVFAIHSAPDPIPSGARVEERDYPTPAPARARSYRDLVDLPEELRPLLPRAFDVIGDIVLIHVPLELGAHAEAIGAGLLQFVPAARLVGSDQGVQGIERLRKVVRIAGEGSWVTFHRENGLLLEVDVEGAYFSPRLAREHDRVARLSREGERVFDLCCGIGPFALTVAQQGRAREVVGIDVNPRAIALLESNARRLGLADRVRAIEGSVEVVLPSVGRCDRAILNLPHEGIKYLAQVLAAVGRGGTLHYYEVTDRSNFPGRAEELLSMTEPRGEWRAGPSHVVHPYSPQSDLVAFTFVRSAE